MKTFKYCPRCEATVTRAGMYPFVCQKCGFRFYFNPAPTNGIFLVNPKGEILLGKRSREPKKERWDVPGGFVDPGETFDESLRREIKEELGIALRRFQYFESYPDRYRFGGMIYPTLNVLFIARATGRERFRFHDDEFSEVMYFALKNIPWKRIAFPWIVRALKDYRAARLR